MQRRLVKYLTVLFCFFINIFLHQNLSAQSKTIIYTNEEFEPIKKVIYNYWEYFNTINSIIDGKSTVGNLSNQSFKSLFDDKLIDDEIIPIDFLIDSSYIIKNSKSDIGTLLKVKDYIIQLKGILTSNSGIILTDFDISGVNKMFHCSKNKVWTVWVMKKFTFRQNNEDTSISAISKITLTKSANYFGEYKITKIELVPSFPKDDDHDFVADNCDECICKLSDRNPVALTVDGYEFNMYKKRPSSRFALTISGSLLSVLNNEFTDKDIVGGNTIIKPGYFNKTGFAIELNGVYTFNSWIGTRVGCIFTQNALDVNVLSNSIGDVLIDTGIVGTIKFNNTTRRLFIPNINLRFGNFNKSKSVLSIEGTLGLAIPTNSSKSLNYQFEGIDGSFGQNGPTQPIPSTTEEYSINFKSTPFLVYGGRINYEFGVTKDGLGRAFINLNFLTGKYDFPNQQVTNPFGKAIIFEGGRIFLGGIGIGFYYNLLVPKLKKIQERLNPNNAKF